MHDSAYRVSCILNLQRETDTVLVKQFEVGNFNIFSYLVADESAKEAPIGRP
jgi:hypothetical protein